MPEIRCNEFHALDHLVQEILVGQKVAAAARNDARRIQCGRSEKVDALGVQR